MVVASVMQVSVLVFHHRRGGGARLARQGARGLVYRQAATAIIALGIVWSTAAWAAKLEIGNFADGELAGWKEKVFSGKTAYQLVKQDDGWLLMATSKVTASGLYKKQSVDLTKTPYLNWTWKVDNVLDGVDERTKAGDDYPARIYVVFSGGLLFWKTRALSYVWSSNQPVNSAWPNAFTANTHMVAARSGTAKLGITLQEKRNVREDFRRHFGEDVTEADAIAIMTDTDNSGLAATAHYGNIYFSSQ